MSLKGSLETVALPELLHLLADTSKTGELQVRSAAAGGRLWVDDGAVCGYEVGDSEEVFEAIFELLRLDGGDFVFHQGDSQVDTARVPGDDHRDINLEIERAQARLAEWIEIVAVVPSLEHIVGLIKHAPSDEVTVDRSQWELLVAIGSGGTVGSVIGSCGLREFEGCRAVKALADRSLAEIHDPVVAVAAEPVVEVEEPVAEVEEPVAEVEEYVEEPVADVDEHVEEGEPVQPRYSELWAAAMEATQDEVSHHGDVDAPDVAAGFVEPVEAVLPAAPLDQAEQEGREALRSLLAEVTATADTPEADETVDGLGDRGPWTSQELASFERPDSENATVVPIRPLSAYEATLRQADDGVHHQDSVPQAEYGQPAYESHAGGYEANGYDEAAAPSPDEPGPEEEQAPVVDEPINRGLLLKFLSSVRN